MVLVELSEFWEPNSSIWHGNDLWQCAVQDEAEEVEDEEKTETEFGDVPHHPIGMDSDSDVSANSRHRQSR